MKGREKSEGSVVPEDRRKATPSPVGPGGGKGVPASEQVGQLGLFPETADSPSGADAFAAEGQPSAASRAVLMSGNTKGRIPPALTIEEVANEPNLREAFNRVASNDGAPGPDRMTIAEVREHLDEIVVRLQAELRTGRYRPGQIRRVWIEKSGGGERGLGIPNVIDRIVGQAIARVLSPHFTPDFHPSSHGFLEGRSCHTAIAEAKRYVEAGYGVVVDIDLETFFDRVNHQRLMARLEHKVKDRHLLRLILRMLQAKVVMPDGVVIRNQEGVPQGGPLSPLLSNIVLDELDWELERRGHHFVRYADDSNIYVRSERSGERVMVSITRFIERRLRLKVNAKKSAVGRPEDRHFLGFRLRYKPEDGSVEILLSQRSVHRIRAKVRELTPRNWGQSLRACIRRINVYTTGWLGYFGIVTEGEERILHTQDAHLRRRLRAIVLKHWRTRRTRARRLIRLGVKPKTAWRRIYDGKKALWALSADPAVQYGLSNAFFRDRGFLSIKERWQERHHQIANAPVQFSLYTG